MGNVLFGVDIAAIIAREVGPGLLPATLTRFTAGAAPARITAAPSSTPTVHVCWGIWEDFDPKDVDNETVLKTDRKALIIGDTLPAGIVPQSGDLVTIEGKAMPIVRVLKRDPAAATYLVHCRDPGGVNGT